MRALVTGTSSGIGLHVAVGLARAGVEVVAAMRDPDRGADLRAAAATAGVGLDLVRLDVTDPDQARDTIADAGDLDILVNNAGRGSVATLEELTDEDLQRQLDVNYLAVARLTRLVLPMFRRKRAGRVVTVTSVGGIVGQPFADAYCASKFAIEGLMQSLAPVAAHWGVTVSVVEPAAVASGFVGNIPTGRHSNASLSEDPYSELRAAYLARSETVFASAQSAEDAAAVVVEAATTAAPRFRWQTSSSAVAFAGLASADLDGSRVLDVTRTWI